MFLTGVPEEFVFWIFYPQIYGLVLLTTYSMQEANHMQGKLQQRTLGIYCNYHEEKQ